MKYDQFGLYSIIMDNCFQINGLCRRSEVVKVWINTMMLYVNNEVGRYVWNDMYDNTACVWCKK